jgi:hypothetical protein
VHVDFGYAWGLLAMTANVKPDTLAIKVTGAPIHQGWP